MCMIIRSGPSCRLLLLDRIEAGRLAAQERERREQGQAAAAGTAAAAAPAAAATGQSREPCVRQPLDTGLQDLLSAAGPAVMPADATATVAAASAPGGTATLRRLERTASSKGSQDALGLAAAAAAVPTPAQNGHIKHE